MPVGWNWTNSMLTRPAPARRARAWPSPVYSHELEVTFHDLPMPPVARITAGASKTMKRPDSRQYPKAPAIAVAVFQQVGDGAFHEHVDAEATVRCCRVRIISRPVRSPTWASRA